MTINCLLGLAKQLRKEDIRDKRILEVGSRDVNGSIRPLVESYQPREYIGVDVVKGKYVDSICDSGNLVEKFGKESFDMVISTSLLEHVRDWRSAVHNIKEVCKRAGTILLTTCSLGFPYHGYPYDFWRFEKEELQKIFSDFELIALQGIESNLVLICIKKPKNYLENDLSGFSVYSIVANKRLKQLDTKYFRTIYFKKIVLRSHILNFLNRMLNYIRSRL